MALHGEYKSPGGKLVVVDLNIEGGRLSKVEVSGDFFLEPPEALADIVGALEGAAADAEEETLAKLVRDGLRAGAELIGFDPESVAVAVRRAVTDGSPRERA